MGYRLSDGTFGVVFNDATKMSQASPSSSAAAAFFRTPKTTASHTAWRSPGVPRARARGSGSNPEPPGAPCVAFSASAPPPPGLEKKTKLMRHFRGYLARDGRTRWSASAGACSRRTAASFGRTTALLRYDAAGTNAKTKRTFCRAPPRRRRRERRRRRGRDRRGSSRESSRAARRLRVPAARQELAPHETRDFVSFVEPNDPGELHGWVGDSAELGGAGVRLRRSQNREKRRVPPGEAPGGSRAPEAAAVRQGGAAPARAQSRVSRVRLGFRVRARDDAQISRAEMRRMMWSRRTDERVAMMVKIHSSMRVKLTDRVRPSV